ncbi:helix-turn-helix domain-containing protein [Parapedobacter sp. 10938]|uniref:helix-turn-helix domain-containing protein n=1 Tax=Parapedobacter flavus TaxID=3110225 RepID=UPI002DB6CDBB|nr:helix-turn-helix domain-containing protein [Parapedobacter sp. 10938]MEC3878724.1 helix-turn-helix domain-containing protein [Parapedobacter sp. 10938]
MLRLGCSTRQLSRAFEGRPVKLNVAIQLMRLYKSQELLRRKRNLSVAQVAAMVHFRNAKHFTTQFKKHFGRTPSEERQAMTSRRTSNAI